MIVTDRSGPLSRICRESTTPVPLSARAETPSSVAFTKDQCNVEYQQEVPSDHVLVVDAFWNEGMETCFIVTKRPFIGPVSDWAIEAEKRGLLDNVFVEAISYSLWEKRKMGSYTDALTKVYQYHNVEEYLENPDKYTEWESDFLRQVDRYR